MLNLLTAHVGLPSALGGSVRSPLCRFVSLLAHGMAFLVVAFLSGRAGTRPAAVAALATPPSKAVRLVFVRQPSSARGIPRAGASLQKDKPERPTGIDAVETSNSELIGPALENSPAAISDSDVVTQVVTGLFAAGVPLEPPARSLGTVVMGGLGGNSSRQGPTRALPTGEVVTGKLSLKGPSPREFVPGDRPAAVAIRLTRTARLASMVTPIYTDEARLHRATGIVKLRALLRRSGSVKVLDVISGLDYGLTQAAINAVSGSRCIPALVDGQPADVIAIVVVEFKLS